MSWVKLNVGGEIFETTRETLTKFPDSRLAEMVNSTKKEDDVLRLDLDPEYFPPVLNWLRHGKLAVPSHLDLELLITIAEEFGLTELAKDIMEKDVPGLGNWIKLDVGGTIFQTSRTTLTQVPDSLLGRMFDPDSSLPPARLQDGAFLIDASPSSFPVILHWLRYRELFLGEVTVENALSAAKYFCLEGLVETLEKILKKLKPESDWIELSADGTIFDSSRAVLIGAKGLLARMFDPRRDDYCPPPRNSKGVYQIDCNPQIFSVVLNMVRDGNNHRISAITKQNYNAVKKAYSRFTGYKLKRSLYFDDFYDDWIEDEQ